MSKRAEALVWERSRAGKTDLLAVIKIADLADDEGRNAFIEVPALARAIRASARGALYVLHRLAQHGEIEIEVNTEGRYIELRGGRQFRPKWFLHVRCVCAWEAYQLETARPAADADADAESEKIADSDTVRFPRGRPSRAADKSEKIAHFATTRNPQSFPSNPKPASEKSEKTRTTYKERPVSDPLVELEQGSATPHEQAAAPPTDPAAEDTNLRVITKLAHTLLDVLGLPKVDEMGDYSEHLKQRCADHHVRYDSAVIRKALDSAIWQRTNRHRRPA
jgi:hypothetical protein